MTVPLIHVVGVGLAGAQSLPMSVLRVVQSATLLIGARRHLASMAETIQREDLETWVLGDFSQLFEDLRSRLKQAPQTCVVILATGDPLFFGVGRLLLSAFPAEQLTFYPQVSSIQLAFSRLKMPWQDATLVSVHGRSESLLMRALKRGDHKIAVLTDGVLTPGAIASLMFALELPIRYQLWVCENLGGEGEQITRYAPAQVPDKAFAALNVVVLVRQPDDVAAQSEYADQGGTAQRCTTNPLPLIGLPDSVFKGYADRPMLMTKREIRLLILGAIAPLENQVIWDIGAGTGSVSVELSRLCPTARIYAIEKTAMGAALIAENAKRLAIAPIKPIQGKAPEAFTGLPMPHSVFMGGSSGQLVNILNYLHSHWSVTAALHDTVPPSSAVPNLNIKPSQNGPTRIVLALATLEHLAEITAWVNQPNISSIWQCQLTQVNIARSLPVGSLTRFSPLNPVIILTLSKSIDTVQSIRKNQC